MVKYRSFCEFKSRLTEPTGFEPTTLQMLTFKLVEICSTRLTTAPWRLDNESQDEIINANQDRSNEITVKLDQVAQKDTVPIDEDKVENDGYDDDEDDQSGEGIAT